MTQLEYENDEKSPSLSYLVAIAAVGADTCYITTGKRGVSFPGLSVEEAYFIDDYRHCSPENQAKIREDCENSANANRNPSKLSMAIRIPCGSSPRVWGMGQSPIAFPMRFFVAGFTRFYTAANT